MKHYLKLIVPVLLAVILPVACGSSPNFSSAVMNKDWNLIEARVKPADIIFDRSTLQTEGFGEIFTLRFDAERVGGVAAPNRYSSPYKQADKQALSIQQGVSTMMAPLPLTAPEKLREHDFFICLQNTYKWGIAGKNLELYTKNESGDEVVLVFAPK
jgi:heat shock protein HslJ